MKRILVTGAGGSSSANFIDSLRQTKEKFYIVGTDTNPFHLQLSTADVHYVVPEFNDPQYLKALNDIVVKEKVEFVHVQNDFELEFISKNVKKLKAKTLLPLPDKLNTYMNKGLLNKKLQENGVKVPRASLVSNTKEIKNIVNRLLEFGDRVWVRAVRGAGSKAALPVANYKQAENWINYWVEFKGLKISDFMISEFLPGREYAFQSLWKDGRLITSQARERLEYLFGNLFPSGQSSSPSVARTVHNEEVNQLSKKAVLVVDPKATGVYCVDLKENSNGEPCVTEINAGRFFTTSNFFARAGLNIPYYYVKMGMGEKLPKMKEFNGLPENLFWIRMMDMSYKLVEEKNMKIKKDYDLR